MKKIITIFIMIAVACTLYAETTKKTLKKLINQFYNDGKYLIVENSNNPNSPSEVTTFYYSKESILSIITEDKESKPSKLTVYSAADKEPIFKKNNIANLTAYYDEKNHALVLKDTD